LKPVQLFLNHLVKNNIILEKEYSRLNVRCDNGFNVYFQPFTGNKNDVLFRTAEYIATGYFHNNQLTAMDHEKN